MILCFSSHKGSEGGEISGNRVSSNHMVINSNLILINTEVKADGP